ncbi:MAG: putative metallophosphoesterase [Chloroflexi bacterium ADurb.Bin325]|nr:MAG: putative metallophosphoesterase [Chloroflexi bacterium ADurb.Bin325]
MSDSVRKALLAAGVAAGLILLYGRYIERGRVRLDRFTVEVDRPGLPPQGVTVLHLSDLHIRDRESVQTVKLARLHRLLADEQYDILALTGDLIHNMAGLPSAVAFLAGLSPRRAAFVVPGNRDYLESSFRALLGSPEERQGLPLVRQAALAARNIRNVARRFLRNEGGASRARGSLGLHANDVPTLLAALAAQGIQPLVNRNVQLAGEGANLWVAGVDDLGNGQPDLAAALTGVPENAPLLLLSHNPDIWLNPAADRADLILSGHTHGGQIRLPLLGSIYRQGTHLGRQRAAGWFERGRTRMFVSRGLGESFPLRLGAPLQAALIRLLPGPGARPSAPNGRGSRAASAPEERA